MIVTHAIPTSDGASLHVEAEGSEFLPALMLSNSLGTDLNLWGFQVQEFSKRFRVVRYDRRGHGRSSLGNAPRTMETLGRDALAIMDALGLDTVHWCGISMGGMVGQWLAANAPGRIDKLILSNTSAYFPNRAPWDNRIKAIRENGLDSIADAIMAIWFTADFRARAPETVAIMRAMLCATPVEGYIASCETVRDMDLRPLLPMITAPTLVIAGKHDQSTPVEAADYIRAHVESALLTVLDAAHITNVELPAVYTELVTNFLIEPR
jgi:3-oxoadipate enol-lactonase